jgi:predicted DNA-binding protein (MmcQ/YjbR family)
MENTIKVIKTMVSDAIDWKNRNYNLVLLLIYFIFTSIQIYNHEYYTADAWFTMSACLAAMICFLGYAHKMLYKAEKKRFPVLKERLTTKIDDAVYINKDDWNKAIMYLADVEDYLERQGLLK